MNAPSIAAVRFLTACGYGVVLGLLYGILRPLRPKHTTFADGVFVTAAAWAWLKLSFGICQGDIRIGYTAGLFVGAILCAFNGDSISKSWSFGSSNGNFESSFNIAGKVL